MGDQTPQTNPMGKRCRMHPVMGKGNVPKTVLSRTAGHTAAAAPPPARAARGRGRAPRHQPLPKNLGFLHPKRRRTLAAPQLLEGRPRSERSRDTRARVCREGGEAHLRGALSGAVGFSKLVGVTSGGIWKRSFKKTNCQFFSPRDTPDCCFPSSSSGGSLEKCQAHPRMRFLRTHLAFSCAS